MNSMRVVFVISSLNAGGAERVVSNIANQFIKDGNDVSIVLFNNICHYELDPAIVVHWLQVSEHRAKYVLSAIEVLKKKLNEIEPDIVISFLTEINVLSILASIGSRWKLIISERNNPYIMPQNKMYRILRKMLYRYADGYVFQTKQAQKYFSKKIQKRSTIIHNPVQKSPYKRDAADEELFHVVAVGRLEKQKNFKLLIDSFSEVYKKFLDCRLTIYGEGKLREELEKQVETLGLERIVELPGNVKNVSELLTKESVFVLSSDYEGMSNALMEAMAVGLPCISTDCPIGGSAELLENGINGMLVPVDDQEKLTEALVMLHQDKKLCDSLGTEAAKIKDTHSIISIAAEWEKYVHKIIGE